MDHLIHTPTSSHIHSFTYDPELKSLTVRFHTTDPHVLITHPNVPLEVFENMKRDVSAGKFYHQIIKRKYPVSR